jgi:hypothetical protein
MRGWSWRLVGPIWQVVVRWYRPRLTTIEAKRALFG